MCKNPKRQNIAVVMAEDTRKESERKRSKRNRDSFRQIIENINDFIYPQARLNTNQCLSMITALFELSKYHIKGQLYTDMDNLPILKETLPVTKKKASSELDCVLKCSNSIGIGFKEDGKIIYASMDFVDKMGLQAPVIGENIKNVFSSHKQIHNMIFNNNKTSFCGHVEIVTFASRKTVNVVWKGKNMTNSEGNRMYLGFIEFIDGNNFPVELGAFQELLMTSDFMVIKRHPYLDSLLGYLAYSSDLFEHLHPFDLLRLGSLQEEIANRGYFEMTLRYLCKCEPGQPPRWLLVFFRILPYVNQAVIEASGAFLIVFLWPFAYVEEAKEHPLEDNGVCPGITFLTSASSSIKKFLPRIVKCESLAPVDQS